VALLLVAVLVIGGLVLAVVAAVGFVFFFGLMAYDIVDTRRRAASSSRDFVAAETVRARTMPAPNEIGQVGA
jgi:hypothetical protein